MYGTGTHDTAILILAEELALDALALDGADQPLEALLCVWLRGVTKVRELGRVDARDADRQGLVLEFCG